jgi:glycosyltransferase involved in cell wall biosynthesis
MKMQKLNLNCPLGLTGYGITSLNIYKELRPKLDITLFPIGGSVSLDSEDDKKSIVEDTNKIINYDPNSPYLKIWHQYDLATRIGKGKYGALTFFEIDRLKPLETHMINCTDTVFVASKWAKDILLNNGVTTNIVISPLGVNDNIFNIHAKSPMKKENNSYVFINIGKWELRKGHDILLEAFNNAFTEADDVELWMVNHNPFLSQEDNEKWAKMYLNSKLGKKIRILPRLPNHSDLAGIISLSDCAVFPARAEGWNNEVMEVMAMNKPVILTNYSAHTEYATKDNSYLVDIDNLTEAQDDKFFDGYGKWADLGDRQIEQLVEHMRFVYNNNIKDNINGFNTAKQYTWTNTANIIYNDLYGN